MDNIRFEGIKERQVPAGYIVVMLDEGLPVAGQTLYPPTSDGYAAALLRAIHAHPDRKAAVIALHLPE